ARPWSLGLRRARRDEIDRIHFPNMENGTRRRLAHGGRGQRSDAPSLIATHASAIGRGAIQWMASPGLHFASGEFRNDNWRNSNAALALILAGHHGKHSGIAERGRLHQRAGWALVPHGLASAGGAQRLSRHGKQRAQRGWRVMAVVSAPDGRLG